MSIHIIYNIKGNQEKRVNKKTCVCHTHGNFQDNHANVTWSEQEYAQ